MSTHEVGIRLALSGRREAGAALTETEQEVAQVGEAAEKAGDQAEQSASKWRRFGSALGSKVSSGVRRFGSALGNIVKGGVVALGALSVAAAATGLKTAASMEQAKIGFTTMLGSAKAAKVFLADLSKFAAKTPFEFPELQTAASSLVSAGIEADKVIPIMTTLGDVTAGMGTGSEGIKRATVALQQMNAAGKITGEDLNQLRDAGIPVYDLLSKALGKTKAEVVSLAQKGKLGGDALAKMMKALETGKGLERFNGLMKKQSKSLSGTWSTLKDTINMGLADAVKPALPLVKRLVNVASDLAEEAMPRLKVGVKGATDAITRFVDSAKKSGVKSALGGLFSSDSAGNGAGVAASLGKIGDAVSGVDWAAVKDGLGQGTADTVSVFSVAIGFAADHVDELARYLPVLVAMLLAYKGAQALGNVAALASIPIRALEVGSQIAHTLALRANTAAITANTTTEKVGLATKIRAGVVTAASTVKTIAMTVATKAAAAGQWLLNAAMTANPIGLVVAAVALLVGGFYLLYRRSETFRNLVNGLWNNVLVPFGKFIGKILVGYVKLLANGWLMMGRFAVMAFRLLVTAAFRAFDGILSAAEKGLGWIPGLDDKIKTARVAFDKFGNAVIGKLQGVENKLKSTQDMVNNLGKSKATIDVVTRYSTSGQPGPGGAAPKMNTTNGPGRVNGGPAMAGRAYLVGEHRPEVFVPTTSGMILPRIPDTSSLADLDVAVGPLGPGGPTVIQLVLPGGRVLAELVLDELADIEAHA